MHQKAKLIKKLIIIFETPITSDKNVVMVENFKKALIQLIDELALNLQEMKFKNLKHEDLLSLISNTLPNGWGYWMEKLSENVFGTGYPDFLWEPQIKKIFSSKFEYSFQSLKELYILVLASLYNDKRR